MASPDRIKIGAYLTESENEALKRVADSLGVSASKAVALAIKAMDEKINKVGKVSLPVSQNVSTDSDTVLPQLTKNDLESAIASLRSELLEEIEKKSELVAA